MGRGRQRRFKQRRKLEIFEDAAHECANHLCRSVMFVMATYVMPPVLIRIIVAYYLQTPWPPMLTCGVEKYLHARTIAPHDGGGAWTRKMIVHRWKDEQQEDLILFGDNRGIEDVLFWRQPTTSVTLGDPFVLLPWLELRFQVAGYASRFTLTTSEEHGNVARFALSWLLPSYAFEARCSGKTSFWAFGSPSDWPLLFGARSLPVGHTCFITLNGHGYHFTRLCERSFCFVQSSSHN